MLKPPDSTDRNQDLARTLQAATKRAIEGQSATVQLDLETASALWAQLLANAELIEYLQAFQVAAVNVDGVALGCVQPLHDTLVPILQQRLMQQAQAEVDRDICSTHRTQRSI